MSDEPAASDEVKREATKLMVKMAAKGFCEMGIDLASQLVEAGDAIGMSLMFGIVDRNQADAKSPNRALVIMLSGKIDEEVLNTIVRNTMGLLQDNKILTSSDTMAVLPFSPEKFGGTTDGSIGDMAPPAP